MDKIFDTDRIALEKLMADEAICWGTVERLARTEEGMGYMILMLVKNLDMGHQGWRREMRDLCP